MIDFDLNKLRNRILADAEAAISTNDFPRLINLIGEAELHYQLDLAYYLIARKAFLENNLEEALDKIRDSLNINPSFLSPLSLKLVVLIKKEDFQAAIDSANSTVQLLPFANHAITYTNKAVAYERMGRTPEAKFCYLTAITLNNSYVHAYQNLLIICVREKEWNDVIVVSKRIGEQLRDQPEFLNNTTAFLLSEAEKLLKSGMNDLDVMLSKEARNLAQIALSASPGNWGALYNLACSYAREGMRDEALKYLRDALQSADSKQFRVHALADDDFAKIRQDQEFIKLLA